jgi:cysteinyl-tRNA synthetase
MYVCGPTVYGDAHLGHGRFLLVFDVIRRYLRWSGFDVTFVSNVTDIEDKIINRAIKDGVSADEVVQKYEAQWWELVERLGCAKPDNVPHATAYVEQMVAYIVELIERGRAYETPDGVYFSVESLEGYGLLARQSLESMRVGGGDRTIVGEDHKRHPADFALWKKAKPNEPSWASPWEPGRPGWHIECTVMALDLLGEDFDLHGGGLDLAFPHHENERAQAVGGGRRFARHWLHNGMVMAAGGAEMHRSSNNYISLADLLDSTDSRAYRLLVLQSHYRSPLEVTTDNLKRAESTLDGIDRFVRESGAVATTPDPAVLEQFKEKMDEDFNTPPALAVMFDAIRTANAERNQGHNATADRLAAAVLELIDMLGLRSTKEDAIVDDHAAALATERDAARAAKHWAKADALRDELVALGWKLEDGPDGTRLSR